jgi:SUR7/PalI family.
LQADLQNLTLSSSTESSISSALSAAGVDSSNTTSELSSLLNEAKNALNLKDFYDIGLFGYCDGNVTNNDFDTTYCSKAKAAFWFNPWRSGV